MTGAQKVTMRVAEMFFDAPAVRRQLSRKRRRALSRQGSFVRREARTLTRHKREKARGQPPAGGRTSEPNLRSIFFAYEPETKGVVIGPRRLSTPGAAGEAHEHGRAIMIRRRNKKGVVRAKYHRRPFMGPGLAKAMESPKWMGPWEEK